MPEQPVAGAANPALGADAPPVPGARRHRVLIATLFVVATILGVVAVPAVWVNRQVLNADNWTNTSSQLLANREIQTAVSAYAVNQLFKSGAPQAELKSVLPTKLQPLAGPVSAGLEQIAGQVAPRVLAAPQVQAAWRAANRAASTTLLKIIDGGGSLVATKGGVVTLNLHAVVSQLAAALGVQQQVAAAQAKLKSNSGAVTAGAAKLGITLPPSSGQLVILRSSQLKTAQDVVGDIKGAALWLPLLTFFLFALAVWLSKGRRRVAMRRVGWCFVVVGVFVLLGRRIGGNAVVDALVKNPSNRAAAHQVWAIGTSLLYDIGAAVIVYGLLFVLAAWLAGHTRPATLLRRGLAPTLRTRPVAVYTAVYGVLLLVILWGPTPATRQLPYIAAFIVLLALGVAALRRHTEREFPDAMPGDTMRSLRAGYANRSSARDPAPTTATGPNGERLDGLERLARLHDDGSLTDAEFASEKAGLMHNGG